MLLWEMVGSHCLTLQVFYCILGVGQFSASCFQRALLLCDFLDVIYKSPYKKNIHWQSIESSIADTPHSWGAHRTAVVKLLGYLHTNEKVRLSITDASTTVSSMKTSTTF